MKILNGTTKCKNPFNLIQKKAETLLELFLIFFFSFFITKNQTVIKF